MRSAVALLQEQSGAVFAEFAGWRLPAHFGDLAAEYRSAITSAVVIDISHTGKLRLTGGDAPLFLSNISTNNIRPLPLGGGCPTYFCDSRARTLFQSSVYHIRLQKGTIVQGRAADEGEHALWLETTPGRDSALLAHLDKYRISEDVEFEDVTGSFAQFHLAGPESTAILEAVLADRMPRLDEYQHMERTIGPRGVCSIRRRDPLGLLGYDIVCPVAVAEEVWRSLTNHGASAAGLATHETLRIEAGTPLYGPDIDENRFVMEVGDVAKAVSFNKGCFLGQEPIVMSRDRAGHAPRAFVGLKSDTKESPLPGAKLFIGADEIGNLTSASCSHRTGGGVALGYVRWSHREPGTVVEAETSNGRMPLTICGLPILL